MIYWCAWGIAFAAFVVTMVLRWREVRHLDRARAAQQRLVNALYTATQKPVDQTDLLDTRKFILGWTRQEFWLAVSTVAALGALLYALSTLPPR